MDQLDYYLEKSGLLQQLEEQDSEIQYLVMLLQNRFDFFERFIASKSSLSVKNLNPQTKSQTQPPSKQMTHKINSINSSSTPTSSNVVPQPFEYFLVLDFEATCEEDTQIKPQEIIEFPTVVVNTKTLQIESEFHHYVIYWGLFFSIDKSL